MNFDRKAYMKWAQNAQKSNPSGQDYHNSLQNPALLGYKPSTPKKLNEVMDTNEYSLPTKVKKNRASKKLISEMIKEGKNK